MTTLVNDRNLEERLREDRRRTGADRWDEVWEGVYRMNPLPNNEHQDLVAGLVAILQEVVGWPGIGKVYAGVNLSDRDDDWQQDYRGPDVAVFLHEGKAQDRGTHWVGPADFLAEIVSAGDDTRGKIPFYQRLGVRELLIVDRDPWKLKLYRHDGHSLRQIGDAAPEAPRLCSEVVPLCFRLLRGKQRPVIEAANPAAGRTWRI